MDMEFTQSTNPTEEVTMSQSTTSITLRSDLPMRGGITIPAGTEFSVTSEALRSLAHFARTAPQIAQTISVPHPLHDGALLAVPVSYISDYRSLFQKAFSLLR
jgi:hypothetical protein